MSENITHEVELSNGAIVALEEGDRELHVLERYRSKTGYVEDWYVCSLYEEGVEVMPNSGDGPNALSQDLKPGDQHAVLLSNGATVRLMEGEGHLRLGWVSGGFRSICDITPNGVRVYYGISREAGSLFKSLTNKGSGDA